MTTEKNPAPVVTPITNTRPGSTHAVEISRIAGPWDLSQKGIKFLEEWEGFSAILYDTDGAGAHGNATIGYGHLVHMGPINHSATEAQYQDGITREAAERLLRVDIKHAVHLVNDTVEVPLFQHEADALICIAYNMHGHCKDLLNFVNTGQYADVPTHFMLYDKAHAKSHGHTKVITVSGLTKRRHSEANVFKAGIYDSTH